MSCVTSKTQQDALVISVYHRLEKKFTSEDTSSCNSFQWTDQSGKESSLLDIRQPQAVADVRGGEVGPLRLYDCENQTLKDRQTYLRETNDITPLYLVVSHVWGDIEEQIRLPTIEWPVPISNKAKLDTILGYCKRKEIKWLWMDILCINQTRDDEDAKREKATEITKMGEYYREAMACLVVPHDYVNFPIAYRHVVDLLFTIIVPGASVQDNAHYIWERISSVDVIMSDLWLWRMWTYQELLLPKKHVLLDDQELNVSHLPRVLAWYYEILRNRSLKRPEGGREYDFIHPDAETVISKNWSPEKIGWHLKEDLRKSGYVHLIALVAHTRDRKSTYPIDRLFGLYGLLSDEEKVEIDPSSHSSDKDAVLEAVWKRTISKVVGLGRVWPLLHDVTDLDPNHAVDGEKWMPDIMAFQRRGDGVDVRSETINHRNSGTIVVKPDGLHIKVRAVGRVVGASVSIGDGGGEMNKIITCTWILKAKGINTDPIVQQLMDGLARSDAVSPDDVEDSQQALKRALHADSLSDCFTIIEKADLRRKLVFGAGLGAWDKMVLTVDVDGHEKPFVFLAWIHRHIPPSLEMCSVFDVTTEPVQTVERWVVANDVGQGTFHKIGTVRSYPITLKDATSSPIIFK